MMHQNRYITIDVRDITEMSDNIKHHWKLGSVEEAIVQQIISCRTMDQLKNLFQSPFIAQFVKSHPPITSVGFFCRVVFGFGIDMECSFNIFIAKMHASYSVPQQSNDGTPMDERLADPPKTPSLAMINDYKNGNTSHYAELQNFINYREKKVWDILLDYHLFFNDVVIAYKLIME